jgi:hypothetical protein
MKNLLILLVLLIGSRIYGQTDSIEKAVIYDKFLSKGITQETFTDIGLKWIQMIKKIGKYPDLPLNQKGQVQYLYLNSYTGFSKEKLFSRALEWVSINYGIYPTYLYSNREDGKIIVNNSFTINSFYSCNYICIITVKNEKLMMELNNVMFHEYRAGYYIDNSWQSGVNVYFSINQVFPIILKKPSDWEFNLNLLKTTNDNFDSQIVSLDDYISSYDFNYLF